MAEVFILLGGNVGDMTTILGLAQNLVGKRVGSIIKKSSIYATESWGFKSAQFWNQVIILETDLSPHKLLNETKNIERELGRSNKTIEISGTDSYQDRTIDIDLLFYDELEINSEELTIPHPKISERRFVLVPLNEVAPEKYHPCLGKKVKELLQLCEDHLKVDRID